MNITKIEWCDYTWNPVVGCKHGCKYCYAKRLNDRFHFIEDWGKPEYLHDRIREPYKLRKSATIFVGSMCDLFGDWVPDYWIRDIINVCEALPQHTFMFLTKKPLRYKHFEFPINCYLGTTATQLQERYRIQRLINSTNGNVIYVSVEPLLGEFFADSFNGIDKVIVGAMTGPNAIKPEKEWINSINHDNIFWKENIKSYRE